MRYELFRPLPEDLDKIEAKDCYSLGEVGCSRTLIDMSWVGKSKDSICLAFAKEGQIHGIAGSYRNWAGSAQAWAVFGARVDEYPIALSKVCHSLINYAVAEQALQRLSLTVRSSYTTGDRFARSLGFTFEGRMRKFLPDGDDANIYSRLF